MTTIAKRYMATLVCGVGTLVAAGWVLASVLGPPGPPRSGSQDSSAAIAAVVFLGVWGTVAGFVAREKGRTLLWILAAFIAPLQVVLLLLPHTEARRRRLEVPPEAEVR